MIANLSLRDREAMSADGGNAAVEHSQEFFESHTGILRAGGGP